jgi:fatty acid-binding protein DegV
VDLGQQLGIADVMVMDLTPAIVTHAGPGVLGVGFFAEG